jgi:hypothetical protein
MILFAEESVMAGPTEPQNVEDDSKQGVRRPALALVLWMVSGLTIGAGVAVIVMAAFWTTPTQMQSAAFQAMEMTWASGVSALIALIGGRQLR